MPAQLNVLVSSNEQNSVERFRIITTYLASHEETYGKPVMSGKIPLDVRVYGAGRNGDENKVDFDFKEPADWGASVLGKGRHAARQLIKTAIEGNPSFFAVLGSDREVFKTLTKSGRFASPNYAVTGMKRIRHFKAVSYGSFNVPVFNFDYDGIGSAFSQAKSIIRSPNIVSLFPNVQEDMLLAAMLSFVPGLGQETIMKICEQYPSVAHFILQTSAGKFSDEKVGGRRIGMKGYKAMEMLGVTEVKKILEELGWFRK